MPVKVSRPAEGAAEGATVALAREPGDATDLDPDVDLTDALLELRAARERLRRVDSLLAALLADGRCLSQNAQEPANTPAGRLPRHAQTLENADADFSRAAV